MFDEKFAKLLQMHNLERNGNIGFYLRKMDKSFFFFKGAIGVTNQTVLPKLIDNFLYKDFTCRMDLSRYRGFKLLDNRMKFHFLAFQFSKRFSLCLSK